MLRAFLVLAIIAGCSGSSSPSVSSFANREQLSRWFLEQCPTPRRGGTTLLEDYTLPAGMEHVQIFTVPLLPEQTCTGKLANLKNVRVEMQGPGADVCAVRIGPAEALAPIDPTFIQYWFSDSNLGARAAGLLSGWGARNYKQMVMLDGIRIVVSQRDEPGTSVFYLIVDGCGHVADSRPGSSYVL